MIKSKIYTSDFVVNTERRWNENRVYFFTYVYFDRSPGVTNPTPVPAMFTHHQIKTAIERARNNPEDIPTNTLEEDFKESWWDKIKFFFNLKK